MNRVWSVFTLAVLMALGSVAIAQSPTPAPQQPLEVFKGSRSNNHSAFVGSKRSLRLTVTVDSPDFLKVKEGDEIREGQVLADNTTERERLERQRKSVALQIKNLKSKTIPKPFEPKTSPGLALLPKANFLEEESQIAQAQLRLQQAQQLLESRTQVLNTDNPLFRAEMEKAESAYRQASEKVAEQEELLRSMQDLKLDASVLRHEQAKLQQLISEQEQAQSALNQARGKLNFSAIEQQQELQRLQINVQLAQSELQLAQSRLETAKSDRKLVEYKASLDTAERIEQNNRSQQTFSQQEQQYAQAIRDRDYQLAQLNLSLGAIEDKLAQIPIIRSPKNGYIRRVKPWTGRDGKYTTVLTISANFERRNSSSTRTNK